MTLPYETCCQLRDAGFPQDTSAAVWVNQYAPPHKDGWTAIGRGELALYKPGAIRTVLARPNSDEMIAAIQQRWPNAVASIDIKVNPAGPVDIVAWQVGDAADDPFHEINLPTLSEALAALYITLAAKEQL